MPNVKVYNEDLQIAQALMAHDEGVTLSYFYKQCYPLFKSIYDNYYTDCESCLEFISEIYVVVLAPSKTTGKCQMENYRGESSLASWLKSASLFYCYGKYQRKKKIPIVDKQPDRGEKKTDDDDRWLDLGESTTIDDHDLNRNDVEAILNSMTNARYARLIWLRYLEQKSDKETAEILGINMDNYYNVHKRAKAQYKLACRKEECYG